MIKNGTILIVEDDEDDKEILEDVIISLGNTNKIVWKLNGAEALSFLCSSDEKMLIIFCDINMPIMNGLELKRLIDADPVLRKKSIPFIFYSTAASQQAIEEAYTTLSIQGFFKKENDYQKTKSIVNVVIEYWKNCVHPNV
ncbi:MAG: response regulator [Flavobacterium circumlabens]|uniref:CheY-like chemotaxis protein n=1 Tax=Flavobacterium circumlabens TaxID=2133765 RepID=A0A4Y7U6X7_9FLAO|nr:response regulator [Flavobacterium circumlabens]TCN50681.1 CheY-like chemotaxis protein [Flavobacterium circumlabens]TEB41838.1 response regulator [Flavobacterium circumlabens]